MNQINEHVYVFTGSFSSVSMSIKLGGGQRQQGMWSRKGEVRQLEKHCRTVKKDSPYLVPGSQYRMF